MRAMRICNPSAGPNGWEINSQGLITPEMGRERGGICLALFAQKISKHFGKSGGDFSTGTYVLEPEATRAAADRRDAARLTARMTKHRYLLLCKHGPGRRVEDLSTSDRNRSVRPNVPGMSKGRREEEEAEQGDLEARTPPGPEPGSITWMGTRNLC